jgi:hypothetical protein
VGGRHPAEMSRRFRRLVGRALAAPPDPFRPHRPHTSHRLFFLVSKGSSEAGYSIHRMDISSRFPHNHILLLPFPRALASWHAKKHPPRPGACLGHAPICSALTALQVPWPWSRLPIASCGSLLHFVCCRESKQAEQGVPPPFVSNCFLVVAPAHAISLCAGSGAGSLHVMLICQVT